MRYFRCPKGAYQRLQLERASQLSEWQGVASSRGWRATPSWASATRYETTGVSHHCSANSAKPPSCSASTSFAPRPDSILDEDSTAAPLRRVYGGLVEHVHNYQVGGHSLHEYLRCEYGEDDTGRADSAHVQGETQGDELQLAQRPVRASAFAIRPPIERFLSGVHEILQRFINDACPLGKRCGNLDAQSSATQTSWYRVAAAGRPVGERLSLEGRQLNTTHLLEAFIDDAMCCRAASRPGLTDGLDLLLSQSTFATYATRGIDVLIDLAHPEPALDALAKRVGKARNAKCAPLQKLNPAGDKRPNVPSPTQLAGALTPPLVERLCELYLQDFVCFDLPLPAACAPSAASMALMKNASDERSSSSSAPSSPMLLPLPRPFHALPAVPRVTIAVLTKCNRQRFAAFALSQIARQTYPLRLLEVLMIDDSVSGMTFSELESELKAHSAVHRLQRLRHCSRNDTSEVDTCSEPIKPLSTYDRFDVADEFINSNLGANAQESALLVRLVRMSERVSIGTKRNLAVHAARGDVILHWDDDDLHHPDRIYAQTKPIMMGRVSMTVLAQSHIAKIAPGGDITFFSETLGTPFMGSLAYRKSVAASAGGFVEVSLAEDLELADRILQGCEPLQEVRLPSVYVRHSSNTWHWNAKVEEAAGLVEVPAPAWVLRMGLLGALTDAHASMAGRTACSVPARHSPPGYSHQSFPYMPPKCCAERSDTSLCGGEGAGASHKRFLQTYGSGDPHITFANGGTADFRGSHRDSYCFVSSPGFQFAPYFQEVDFYYTSTVGVRQLVHGTFMTRAHWRMKTSRGTEILMRADAMRRAELDILVLPPSLFATPTPNAAGVAASMRRFALPQYSNVTIDDIYLETRMLTISVSSPSWQVNVTSKPVYEAAEPILNETHWHGRWDPEQRRFDIAIRGVFPQEKAHGVIGQSYRDGTIRSGKKDEYGATSTPGLVNDMGMAPPMTTSAQAEGAIDGTYLDYRLSSPFETNFKFSSYLASPSPATSGGARSGRFRTASTSEWR